MIRIKLININDFVGDAVGKFKNPNSKVKNKVPIGSISNGKMSNDSSEIHSLLGSHVLLRHARSGHQPSYQW